ncbi:ORF6N domain-containing protein [Schinkia azotoformans]|uniref:ORF6N domain-containing protein n=1 Tax=Schinkia azotoformans TaxID=1454 RepID=UPI002DC030FE|nr:ORF6N domain-containing protein [Schinkia azotoformans]MEC1757392.1 ORF6N domain-containing protein [Schinkia azotoformans]
MGKREFNGVEIFDIEGGFGEGKKCILAIDVADIHDKEVREVNQNINRLIDKNRITEGVHFIDLLDENFKVTVGDLGIKIANRTKNVFLLSERGYYSLVKYMDDDKSWDIHDKLVDNYFNLKEFEENVQQNLDSKGSYNRLDDLNYKFSEKRTIKTFSNCNVMELPKRIEEFKEYLGTIKNTMVNGEITYATEIKKARYDSMLKGLERLRVTLDIGLSHHLLEKYIQPLTREKHKLENKKNGGDKTAQTKKIKKLEQRLIELDDTYIPDDTAGIYSIQCLVNEKRYVGRSMDIARRFAQHKGELESGTHWIKSLQRDWNKYGEGRFKFEVIEETDDLTLEGYYIEHYDTTNKVYGYNTYKA